MKTDSAERESKAAASGYRRAIRALRWALLGVGGLLILLLLAIAALFAFSIPIDLSDSRQYLSGRLSIALDRSVYLEDSIIVTPSLSPTLELRQLRVGPPSGWPQSEFARLGELRLQLALLPLLKREIRVEELVVDDLQLRLETNSNGQSNWSVAGSEATGGTGGDSTIPLIDFAAILATNLDITYRDAVSGRSHALELARINATVQQQQPVTLSADGSLDKTPFSTRFSGGGLADLAATDKPWPVSFEATTLGADLRFDGGLLDPLQLVELAGEVELKLPSTHEIKTRFALEMPFGNSFALKGHLQGGQRRLRLRDIEAEIDDKIFTAQIGADISAKKPRFDGSIHSAHIDVGRLFEAIEKGNYAPEGVTGAGEAASVPDDLPAARTGGNFVDWDIDTPFLDTAWLGFFDASLELVIDEVVGAPTTINGLSLGIEINDGVLTSPATVQLAGVPFIGQFDLVTAEGMPSLQLSH